MLHFEAILNFPPSPKVVISVPDCGVAKLLSLINMSSKRPAPAPAGSPSSRPPTQRFRLSPAPPSSAIGRPPPFMQSLSMSTVVNIPPAYSSQLDMQLDYPLPPMHSTPHTSQQAACFAAGELNKILTNPVAAEEHDDEEVRHFYIPPERNITRASRRAGAAPPILRSQPLAERPRSPETSVYEPSVESEEESAPRLRTEQEEHMVRPLGGGLFFKYRLVLLAKL